MVNNVFFKANICSCPDMHFIILNFVTSQIDPRPNLIPPDDVYLEPSDVVLASPPPYQSLPEVTKLAEQGSEFIFLDFF